jgi:hypothetical protein
VRRVLTVLQQLCTLAACKVAYTTWGAALSTTVVAVIVFGLFGVLIGWGLRLEQRGL